MEFHGIEMMGEFINQLLSSKPTYTSDDEGRLIFVQDENALYCGSIESVDEWMLMIDGTSDQTIGGTKTFSSIPYLPSSDPTHDDHAVRKGYLDDLINSLTYKVKVSSDDTTASYLYNKLREGDGIEISVYNGGGDEDVEISIEDIDSFVRTTTDQTVADVKTFTSFPILPSSEPSSNYQAAHKKYVDDQIDAIGGGSDTYKILISSNDETPAYLYSKVIGSDYIEVSKTGTTDEDLTIDFTDDFISTLYKVKVSSNDTTPGYLINKLIGTGLTTISEYNDSGNERVTIDTSFDNITMFGEKSACSSDVTYDKEENGFIMWNLPNRSYLPTIDEPNSIKIYVNSVEVYSASSYQYCETDEYGYTTCTESGLSGMWPINKGETWKVIITNSSNPPLPYNFLYWVPIKIASI